jgi:imidazolonepropionase-like amidohydrolase
VTRETAPFRANRKWPPCAVAIACRQQQDSRTEAGLQGARRRSAPTQLAEERCHVRRNQLGFGPGVQLAVELGAASVDHCTYLNGRRSCPRPTFHRQPCPDARRAIDAGVDVAIATNCNPRWS